MTFDMGKAAKMWADGTSYTHIAAFFGVTKGVVSGLMHRNRDKFPKRTEQIKKVEQEIADTLLEPQEDAQQARRTANTVRRLFHEAQAVYRPVTKVEAIAYDLERIAEAKTLDENVGCKWPVSDNPYLFCGAKKLRAKSWCEHHQQRAWRSA